MLPDDRVGGCCDGRLDVQAGGERLTGRGHGLELLGVQVMLLDVGAARPQGLADLVGEAMDKASRVGTADDREDRDHPDMLAPRARAPERPPGCDHGSGVRK